MNDLFTQLPRPADKRIAISIKSNAERHLRAGHPWIFDQSITKISHEGKAGDLAVIFDKKRKFIAIGLFDPDSPIRVRVLHQGKTQDIDEAFFIGKMDEALMKRKSLADQDTNGYRVIHGENDGFSGLVVDRYAETLVIKLYSRVWLPYLEIVVKHLGAQAGIQQIVLRLSRSLMNRPDQLYGLSDGQFLMGEPIPMPLQFRENGLVFAADVIDGHKTGFFFDHRDNRAKVGEMAKGRDVLDMFAYAGAFSLYAARGGARSVTSVDISAPALQAAKENFLLNQENEQVANCQHQVLVGDAFEILRNLNQEEYQYDMVIVDPPSFAKSAGEIEGALHSYDRLTRMALGLLRPKGILVIASCSSRVSADEFYQTVLNAARHSGYSLEQIERQGHAIDHPIGFEEGAYLKCLFARLA